MAQQPQLAQTLQPNQPAQGGIIMTTAQNDPVNRVLDNIYNDQIRPQLCTNMNNLLMFKSDRIDKYSVFQKVDHSHDLLNERGSPFGAIKRQLLSANFIVQHVLNTIGILIPYNICMNGNGRNSDFGGIIPGHGAQFVCTNPHRQLDIFNPYNSDYYNTTNPPGIEYDGDKRFSILLEQVDRNAPPSDISLRITENGIDTITHLYDQSLYINRITILLPRITSLQFGVQYTSNGNNALISDILRSLLHEPQQQPPQFGVGPPQLGIGNNVHMDEQHRSDRIHGGNRDPAIKNKDAISYRLTNDVPMGTVGNIFMPLQQQLVNYGVCAKAIDAATPGNIIHRNYPYFYPCCTLYSKVFNVNDRFKGCIFLITHFVRENVLDGPITINMYFIYIRYDHNVNDLDFDGQNIWITNIQTELINNIRLFGQNDIHPLNNIYIYQVTNNAPAVIPAQNLQANILPGNNDLYVDNIGNNNCYVFKIEKTSNSGISVRDIRTFSELVFTNGAPPRNYILSNLTNLQSLLYTGIGSAGINGLDTIQGEFLIKLTKVSVIIFALSNEGLPQFVVPNIPQIQQQRNILLPAIINSANLNNIRFRNPLETILRDPLSFGRLGNANNRCIELYDNGPQIQNVDTAINPLLQTFPPNQGVNSIGVTYTFIKYLHFIYIMLSLIKRMGDKHRGLDQAILQNTIQNNQDIETQNNTIFVLGTHDLYLQNEVKNCSGSFYDSGKRKMVVYLGPSAYIPLNNNLGDDMQVVDEINNNNNNNDGHHDMPVNNGDNVVEVNNEIINNGDNIEPVTRKRGHSMDNYIDIDDDDDDDDIEIMGQSKRFRIFEPIINAVANITTTVFDWFTRTENTRGGGKKITIIPLTDIVDIIKILCKKSDEIYIFQISQHFVCLLCVYYYYSVTDTSVKDAILRIFLEKLCKIALADRPNNYLNDRIISYLLKSQKIDLLGELMFLNKSIRGNVVIPREFIDKHEMLISIFSGYEFLYNGPENDFLRTTPQILDTTQIFKKIRLMHINTSKKIDHFDASLGDKLSDMDFCLKVIHYGVYYDYEEQTTGAISVAYSNFIFSKDGIKPEYPPKVKEIETLLSSLSTIEDLLKSLGGNLHEIDNTSEISSINTLLLMVDNILSLMYYYSCTGEILQPPIFDLLTNLVQNFYRLLCEYFDGIEIKVVSNTIASASQQMNKSHSYTKNTQSPFLQNMQRIISPQSSSSSVSAEAAGGKSRNNKKIYNKQKHTKKHPRVRKTRKNTKRPKYIKKHATKRRR